MVTLATDGAPPLVTTGVNALLRLTDGAACRVRFASAFVFYVKPSAVERLFATIRFR
jgi:hypothetical protein